MAPSKFRAVYKLVGEEEIDTIVHLPLQPESGSVTCPVLINIHGGAFMLGAAEMVNQDQISDCVARGWIVLAPNHRLCPQVNLLEGPIQDCRDMLSWVYSGGLVEVLRDQGRQSLQPDLNHVFAFGTSSGGTLALCLGFDVPRPVAGIYDMYGPCNMSDDFWTTPLASVAAKLPKNLSNDFLNRIFEEDPVPIRGGVSLEGQAPGPPDFTDPRQAFAMTQIARGSVMKAIFPSEEWSKVDPLRNITPSFPPTFIVHGDADTMVPLRLSRDLLGELRQHGVQCGIAEVPGEEHTFAARMALGSATWNLQRQGFDFLQALIK